MRELNEIRRDITEIDKEIQALFLCRMHCAEEVSDSKMASGGKVLVEAREAELLQTLEAQVPEHLRQEYAAFLKTTTRVSRKHQYQRILSQHPERLALPIAQRNNTPETVCYQGVPTSYGESAAKVLFPNAKLVTADTFENVFKQVREGKAQVGVVPVENSTAGSVNEVYDWLVKYNLYISHSHISDIQHCLAACNGATMDTVTQVYSHPQALSQCHDYLAGHQFTPCPMSNTAGAAKSVAALKNPTFAAICSVAAAKLYGLTILEERINDGEKNQTRFIAVTPLLSAAETDNRVSILFTLPHIQGSLSAALSIFSDHAANLTEIHSRPLPETPWNYRFYLDFTGNVLHSSTRSLLYQLIEELPFVQLLGSYSVSYQEEDHANQA